MSKDIDEAITTPIEGFTVSMQREIIERAASLDHIDVESLKNLATYSYVVLALKNESLEQLIRAIEVLEKRYKHKDITKEALGYLSSLKGKAYANIALRSKNYKTINKNYKNAAACFKQAYQLGYKKAIIEFGILKKDLDNRYDADAYIRKNNKDWNDTLMASAYLDYDFDKIAEMAIRVLTQEEPLLIEDSNNLDFAKRMYGLQIDTSNDAKMLYGLLLIGDSVYPDDMTQINQGIKYVKEAYEQFKLDHKNLEKEEMGSTVENFNKYMKLIEKHIIKKTKKR